MRRALRLVVALAAPFVLAGCFNPDQPTCSYSCADSDPKCPDDYECRADGYCHLIGTGEGACGFTPADMSIPVSSTDMSQSPSD